MRHSLYILAFALLRPLAAVCNRNSFPLGQSESTNDGGSVDDADPTEGDGGGNPDDPDAAMPCTPSGLDNQCDEIDNDCDGMVDEEIDKDADSANCGTCGTQCISPGAVMECQSGTCTVTSCQPGFKNLDTSNVDCEYICPVFPEQAEDCNGLDDDCDGLVDLADPNIIAPPSGQCRTTAGTPCSGTGMICDTRGAPGLTRWYCDYSAQVEFDPSVPNGIVQQEVLCDSFDGDCDGVIDDPFNLGGECNNALLGICYDRGTLICDPSDNTMATCDYDGNDLPPIAEGDITECNAIDEDCDGSIDEGDHSVWVDLGGTEIMAYEASRPDATGALPGSVESIGPCSKPGALPWTEVSYVEAQAQCATIGARLCTETEWEDACAPGFETVTNVVIEAETATVVDRGSRTWVQNNDANASGGVYMRAEPDGGGNELTSAGAAADSQRMDFSTELPTAGTWTVWIRGRGDDNCDDYVWFGAATPPSIATPDSLFKRFNSNSWLWYSNDDLSYRVQITAPAGPLDFSLWMGCGYVRIDKIAFTSDPNYIATAIDDPPAMVDETCRYAYDDTVSCLEHSAGVCNDSSYADPDDVYATGTENACFADQGAGAGTRSVFDMSGNVKEWAETRGLSVNPIRGGAFNSGASGTTCQFATTADDDLRFSNIGFRCCR